MKISSTPPDLSKLSTNVSLENPLLTSRIANSLTVSDNEAQAIFTEVLRFLYLVSISKDRLTPSVKIDEAWHEFILFTRLYTKICLHHFGRYIHHSPGGDNSDNAVRFELTLQNYERAFGPVPRGLWGIRSDSDPAPCGACRS